MDVALSFIFSAGYYIISLSVLLRCLLMLVAYLKTSRDGRKTALNALLLSAVSEILWCALVGVSFQVSRFDFIPFALAAAGLFTLRRIAPFEKVGSQHVYSLLTALIPSKQATLAKATALHLF